MRYYYSLLRYQISLYNHQRIRKKINYTHDALLKNRREVRVLENKIREKNYYSFLKKY